MSPYFNVPVPLVDSFKDQTIIIRSHEPSELVEALAKVNRDHLRYMELTSLNGDPNVLWEIEQTVPLNLVVDGGAFKFSSLYKFARGPRKQHPIRVTVPASPSFGRVVKLAGSLGFPVKIEATQPSHEIVEELIKILEYYLHNPTVSQPIEFFHSILNSLFRGNSATIWEIQEEDPSISQYVTDEGNTVLSRRLQTVEIRETDGDFVDGLKSQLLMEGGECRNCSYFSWCLGYFKLPDRQYKCHNVRRLFGSMQEAAAALSRDYEKCMELEGSHNNGP
jgi:hypothetical protein